MKISKSRRPSNKIIALLVAITVLLFIGVYVFISQSQTPSNSIVNPVKKDGKETVEIKDKPIGDVDYSTPTNDEANPATDPLPSEQPSSPSGTISVSVSYSAGDNLKVRTVINEIIATGSCTLSLKKTGQQTISQSTDVFAATSYSTCKGFDIDDNKMAKGTWDLTINVKSGDRSGSASTEVTIE